MTDEDKLFVLLLEAEVEALRSVLAAVEGDKHEYGQMLKADAAAAMRLHLRRPQ
jgi:hypothetical protein